MGEPPESFDERLRLADVQELRRVAEARRRLHPDNPAWEELLRDEQLLIARIRAWLDE